MYGQLVTGSVMPLAASRAQSHLKVQHVQRSNMSLSLSLSLCLSLSLSFAISLCLSLSLILSLWLSWRVLFAQLSLFILLKALANTHALEAPPRQKKRRGSGCCTYI